jgi:hypothetical protein
MKRYLWLALSVAVLAAVYLGIAWVVVKNTDACWWPWHDILPGNAHLCSVGM